MGSCPIIPGMKRSDMIISNRLIFMEQSKALSLANPNVKCVVVANPIHSNTLMLSHFDSYVKKENISSHPSLDSITTVRLPKSPVRLDAKRIKSKEYTYSEIIP